MTANLFDVPGEVLVQIIEYLNARERIALSRTCRTFKRIVFQDIYLLRDLDFSEDGRRTSESDIREYFGDENVSKHVLKVNLRNVNCIDPGPMLNNLIGRAINLVDIDVYGVTFTNVRQIASFLKPLVHNKKLCISFPDTIKMNLAGYDDLKESFARLKHLSVRLTYNNHEYSSDINFILHVCTQLEDLRMVRANIVSGNTNEYIYRTNPKILPNLKFIQFIGRRSHVVKNYFIRKVLPDPRKWTEFPRVDPAVKETFTLVKNVRVSEGIQRNEVTYVDPSDYAGESNTAPLPVILSERLLEQVIRRTCENWPKRFCSLSRSSGASTSMLKTEETKRLLENPRYRISYLYLDHDIERECDAYVVASTFPSIAKLHLFNVVKSRAASSPTTRSKRHRPNERNTNADQPDEHACFKLLVRNAPNVRELTISGRKMFERNTWDFDALHEIKNWTNLKTLRVHLLPITTEEDGSFLIEIGKHCRHLETLDFHIFGKSDATISYMKCVSRMLIHCRNLKDFSLRQESTGQLSDVFDWFVENSELRRICVLSRGRTDDGVEMVPSIERLVRRCSKLSTFLIKVDGLSSDANRELLSAVGRIQGELNRPRFPIQENDVWSSDESWIFDAVQKDSSLYWYPCTQIANYFWQNPES